MESATG